MNDVQLTAGMRSNLLLLQNTQSSINRTQNRLSTGNKINSALDGPAEFFSAKGLTQRAGDLTSLKDAMGQAVNTVKAADQGISSIEDMVEQARGLTTQALSSLGTDASSVATRKNLADQFNGLLRQIDGLAQDSGYQGKNLLTGNGLRFEATSTSKSAVNALAGVSGSRVTNVVSADTYSVAVTGNGAITGSATDIANAEQDRGISNLEIAGFMSASAGNFDNVEIEMTGGVGKNKVFTVTEGNQSITQEFTVAQFDAAKAAGTVLNFNAAFTSGTQVSFDVDFEAIEDVADTAGVGGSVVEKHVDVQVTATQMTGLVAGVSVARDGIAELGLGKISDGENAFAFETGTARFDVDERAILQSSTYADATGSVTGSLGVGFTVTSVTAEGTGANHGDNVFTVTSERTAHDTFSVTVANTAGDEVTVAGVNADGDVTFAQVGGANGSEVVLNVDLSALGDTTGDTNSVFTAVTDSGAGTTTVTAANSTVVQDANYTVTINDASTGDITVTDNLGGSVTATVGDLTTGGAVNNVDVTIAGGSGAGAVLRLNFDGNAGTADNDTATFSGSPPLTAATAATFAFREGNTGATASLTTQQVTDASDANNLTVQFNELNTSSVTVVSQNVQTNGQGLQLDFAQNDFTDRADIERAIAGIDNAKSALRSASTTLGDEPQRDHLA